METSWVVRTQGNSVPGILWVEARDAIQYTMVHRVALTTEHDPAPTVNGDIDENLLKFRLHQFGVTSDSLVSRKPRDPEVISLGLSFHIGKTGTRAPLQLVSVYSCHLFLISSASVRSILFLSFIEPIFA